MMLEDESLVYSVGPGQYDHSDIFDTDANCIKTIFLKIQCLILNSTHHAHVIVKTHL